MKKFATALNCMDGRVQLPVIELIKARSGADYVDMITEAGIEKIVAEEADIATLEAIKEKIDISVEKHGSEFIAIAGHHDCAGNPASEAEHKEQIKAAVKSLKKLYSELTVIGVWVDEEFKANVVGD